MPINAMRFERDIPIDEYAANYFKQGGTLVAWIDAGTKAANGMPGEGHNAVASVGRLLIANARQPIPSEGQSADAKGGQINDANARNQTTNGGGHVINAEKGRLEVAAPVREPTKGQISAVGAARLAAARTVLDTCKTHDGRAWGNVGAHELDSMKRDGGLAKAIKDHIGQLSNFQRFMPVRDLITAKQFQKLLDKERANAA